MNSAFKELFGPVRAEEDLKDRTRAHLAERTRGYTKRAAAKRGYPAYAAACACLALVLLGGRWLYFTPTAEISMDINPSIELSVNRFDRVIAVTGFNEDGRELTHELNVKYKHYAQAVEQVLHHDSITALLSDGEVMSITVAGPDEQHSARLLSGVEACAAGHHNVDCYSARPEEAAAAHEAGLSCGKYRVFLELQRLDPDITPEAVQGMTMREIRDRIDSLSSGGGSDFPPSGGWGGGHHGNDGGHGGWRHGRDGQSRPGLSLSKNHHVEKTGSLRCGGARGLHPQMRFGAQPPAGRLLARRCGARLEWDQMSANACAAGVCPTKWEIFKMFDILKIEAFQAVEKVRPDFFDSLRPGRHCRPGLSRLPAALQAGYYLSNAGFI